MGERASHTQVGARVKHGRMAYSGAGLPEAVRQTWTSGLGRAFRGRERRDGELEFFAVAVSEIRACIFAAETMILFLFP